MRFICEFEIRESNFGVILYLQRIVRLKSFIRTKDNIIFTQR